LAHPAPDAQDLDAALRRLCVADTVIVMRGQTIRNPAAMRELARTTWNIADIGQRYVGFVKRFRPLLAACTVARSRRAAVTPKAAFLVRTLLIQEYRKVLLRDPLLPADLLPANWHGTAAYQLCRNLYRAVYAQADDYLTATIETADGPLPPANKDFLQRFGGLE